MTARGPQAGGQDVLLLGLLGLCVLVTAACGEMEVSRSTVRESGSAISFGPCRDCVPHDMPDGGVMSRQRAAALDGSGAPGRVFEFRAAAPNVPEESSAPTSPEAEDEVDSVEPGPVNRLRVTPRRTPALVFGFVGIDSPAGTFRGAGPAGMGPCADCLLASVKVDDLGVASGDIGRVEKAHLELSDGSRHVSNDPTPWGRGVSDDGQPELWIGVPLGGLKADGMWAIHAVHMTLSLRSEAESRDVSAPPQATRVEGRGGFEIER